MLKALPDSQEAGYSAIYAVEESKIDPKLDTLSKLWKHALQSFTHDDCLGVRRFHNTRKRAFDDFYTYETFDEVDKRKHAIGCGLIHLVTHHDKYRETLSISGKPEFVVAISSANRAECILVDMASRDFSLVNTALYPTLGEESSRHILDITEAPIVFASGDQIDKLLDVKADLPYLNTIVSFDEFNYDHRHQFNMAKQVGVTLIDLRAVEKTGERHPLPRNFNPPTRDTAYTISFTSGTTGLPKGVVVPHEMAVCGINACQTKLASPIITQGERDFLQNRDPGTNEQITALCHLPLAHIYERQIAGYGILSGFRLAMPSTTDPSSITSDLRAAKPHYFASVPRVFNRFMSLLKAEKLLPGVTAHPVDDLLLRNHARSLLGFDRCRYLISGSAPLGVEAIRYLRNTLDIGFCIAYGCTETYAGIYFGDAFEQTVTNSCGTPCGSIQLRIRSVSEMGYTVDDSSIRGELMLRGPQIFTEYYKDPIATNEAFTAGFYHTGDIVSIDGKGNMYIIDRVKNFFKLAQGEYVTPERIENIYLERSPLLTQLFIHGDSLQDYLVAVAGVSLEYAAVLLKDRLNKEFTPEQVLELLQQPKYKCMVLKQLNHDVRDADLQGFEKVHNIHWALEPLKMEDEVLTPTMKIKRPNARKHFAKVLRKLYDEGSLVKNSRL